MTDQQYMTNQQIKQELVRMLKEIDDAMSEAGLKYTIFSGTLLGAVRHGGFIPWDDDLDIAMLRPEYEKLLAMLRNSNHFGKHLSGEGFELGNGEIPYIKLVDRRFKVIEQITDYSELEDYLWVDVFPIDGVPEENPEEYFRELDKLIHLYQKKRIRMHRWQMEAPEVKQGIKARIGNALMDFVSFDSLTAKLIRLGQKYPVKGSKLLTNTLWGIGFKEAFPAEYMEEMVRIPFENIEVMGMKHGKDWLAIRYGDYMKLPPEDQRESHGLKAWRVAGEE